MPAGIPSGGKPGAPPLIPTNPFAYPITYPSSVGTLILTVNLLPFMTVGTQSRQGPTPGRGAYSDAWLEIVNFSDSMLSPIFDTGTGPEPPIPPGYAWAVPIPMSATVLTATVLMQTTTQQFPNELAFATFYTASDIASGHIPRNGPLVPSVPAASIGGGTLPANVIAQTANQTNAHFAQNSATSQVAANTSTGIALNDQVGPHGYLVVYPAANDAQARGMSLGRIDAAGVVHFGECFEDTAGVWNAAVIQITGGPSASSGKFDFESPFMVYRTPQTGATAFAHVFQSYTGVVGSNGLGVGTAALGTAATTISDTGVVLAIAAQNTAGGYGVPPIIGSQKDLAVSSNATVHICAATTPNDGTNHLVRFQAGVTVTSSATNNGTCNFNFDYFDPNLGSSAIVAPVWNGNAVVAFSAFAIVKAGLGANTLPVDLLCSPNTTVQIAYSNSAAGTIADKISGCIELLT